MKVLDNIVLSSISNIHVLSQHALGQPFLTWGPLIDFRGSMNLTGGKITTLF